MTFSKALWVRLKLLLGYNTLASESLPLAIRYPWLFTSRWLYSPSVAAMLAANRGFEEAQRKLKRGRGL